jgi:DNA-binding Lrp family transcriptional regulator
MKEKSFSGLSRRLPRRSRQAKPGSEAKTDIERRVLAVVEKGFPVSRTPYADMAKQAGLETAELLAVLERWKRQGRIRRTGAVVNHFKVGLGAGAMVAWEVEEARVEDAGKILAGFEDASHVYERKSSEEWPYNVYTMVHGKSREDVEATVRRMSEACGVLRHRVLFTQKELKKSPPRYIEDKAC